jgi:DNA-binding transcriptional regulator GbsR (MarR family)
MNDDLVQQAEKLQAQIKKSLDVHTKMLDELSSTLQDSGQKELINNIKLDITKTLSLAKSGDMNAINEILNRYAGQTNK